MNTQPEYGCDSATRHTYCVKNYTFQEYAFTPITKDKIRKCETFKRPIRMTNHGMMILGKF
jgi:hypothetical protein